MRIIDETNEGKNEGGAVRSLYCLFQGILSAAPIISGTSQFPNPPSIACRTINRIVTNAWAVTASCGFNHLLIKPQAGRVQHGLKDPGQCLLSQLRHQIAGAGCQRPCGLVECHRLVSTGSRPSKHWTVIWRQS